MCKSAVSVIDHWLWTQHFNKKKLINWIELSSINIAEDPFQNRNRRLISTSVVSYTYHYRLSLVLVALPSCGLSKYRTKSLWVDGYRKTVCTSRRGGHVLFCFVLFKNICISATWCVKSAIWKRSHCLLLPVGHCVLRVGDVLSSCET